MIVSHIKDSLDLKDPVKRSYMKSYEREAAERLKDIPTFFEWFHYNCFGPLSWMGQHIEYFTYIDFINYVGPIRKMPDNSDIIHAVSRYIEYHICFQIYTSLNRIATPMQCTEPWFHDTSYWY